MFVRVGGIPHHVAVAGEGPVVVLSAGLGLGWFDWDPVVPLLTPYRTVVRFDRPGHGLSAPAGAPPTAAGEARRITGILDALGLGDRPATVVGHSVAGFHAEAYARLHPGRTTGIVLVDSSVEERAVAPAVPALRTAAARAVGGALGALGVPAAFGPPVRRLAVRVSRTGGGDPAPAELIRAVYGTTRVLRGALLENAHYTAVAAELLALRERRPLPPGAPVTVLAATAGGRRWTARQRDLALTLDARFRAIGPSGHLMMLDRPDAVARAVLESGPPPPGGGAGSGRGQEDRA
ncbi:alpha/beta hydrolase [Streptomyces sp. NPDC020875]|uniref:alpha/beta fold hydrolase n=1 Tax=Streptomyces sp. NPDC020875 TaxID=3154898 RepID=UPI0033D69A66